MAATLWSAATSNGFSTTLDGSISDTDTTITLTTVTGLVAPGVLVIDRQDSDGNDTPNTREYITFTGISSQDLTGCSRGVAGSSAQAHSSGAIIEETMSITHWNDLVSFLNVSHDASGNILSSAATITTLTVPSKLDVSGASIVGNFPLHPTWVIGGVVSGASVGIGGALPAPQAGRLKWLSVLTSSLVSGASLVLDINVNGTTMFSDQNTRLSIPGGSQYASTASIGAPFILGGQKLTLDIDSDGFDTHTVTVVGRIE